MKRRDFFKCMAGVATTLALPVVLPKVEPEVIGVDMGAEGTDATVVSLHGTNAAVSDDLGGFLVPQEYTDKVLGAMNVEGGRNSVFRGASRIVPADPNLLRARREFAEFLKAGAA